MVHDALGQAGGAAGVIDGDVLILVSDDRGDRIRRTSGQEFLVIHSGQRLFGADVADIDDGFDLGQLAQNRLGDPGEFIIDEQGL